MYLLQEKYQIYANHDSPSLLSGLKFYLLSYTVV